MLDRLRAAGLALAVCVFILNMMMPSLPSWVSALSFLIILGAVLIIYEARRRRRNADPDLKKLPRTSAAPNHLPW